MANSDNNKDEAPLAFTENIIEENGEERLAKDVLKAEGEKTDIDPISGEDVDHDSKFNPYQDVVNDPKAREDENK